MRRSRVLPVALILWAGALAGCSDASQTKDAGGSDPLSASGSASPSGATSPSAPRTSRSRTPTASPTGPTGPSRRPGGGSSATASEEPSGPAVVQPTRKPHLPRDRVEAAALHKSVLVRSSAGTTQEQAVVGAWMDYWQAASDTFYFVRPTKRLRALARDQALSSVLDYIGTLKKDQHRVVGWAKDNVTSVEIDGDQARVRDCTENFTFSVDVDGDPVTRPQPFYEVTGTLVRDGGRWLVTRTHSRDLTSTCLS